MEGSSRDSAATGPRATSSSDANTGANQETQTQQTVPVASSNSSSLTRNLIENARTQTTQMDSLPRPFAGARRPQTEHHESSPGQEDANPVGGGASPPPTPEDLEQLRQRFLAAALSAPLSNDAVSGRLLQALPQISIGQFLQDFNNQTPPWRGFAPSRQGSSEVTTAVPEDDSETGRLLPTQEEARLSFPPRSRRRSSGSSLYSMSSSGEFERSDSQQGNAAESAQPSATARNSTRPRRNTEEESDDQTAMDELQSLFRRCHNSLPFVALFLIYFAYQHATGILVFVVGTVAVMGLDQRLRVQVALKDKANTWHLLGIIAMCAIDMVAICSVDGEPNPFRHFSKMFEPKVMHDSENDGDLLSTGGIFWQVLWTVLVNDFIVRLWSIVVKAFVAGAKSERFNCERKDQEAASSEQPSATIVVDEEAGSSAPTASSSPQPTSSASFYRRKRKLYGIIEMCSIFLRSLLASIPWCSFYQLCTSRFMGDVFTFAYLFIKGLILATQGRRIYVLARSLIKLGLEFGSYVTHDELVEAGSPDCSICYEPMRQPVKLACSHMFCEECVAEWFDRERSCPLCRASVTPPGRNDESEKPQYLDGRTSLVPQLL